MKVLFVLVSYFLVSVNSIHQQCLGLDEKPLKCNKTQILCTKGFSSSTGCSRGYYCHDMKHPCDTTCPCLESEFNCQTGYPYTDPLTGCPSLNSCIPKDYVNYRGNVCKNYCPAKCGVGFKICPSLLDKDGCSGPEVCISSLASCPPPIYDNRGCLIKKGKLCKQYCPKIYDENGCPEDIICTEDVDGQCPPSKFDSRGCPVVDPISCGPDEVRCSKGFDEKNCLVGFTCQKKFTKDNCINYCPTVCDEKHEQSCSQGIGFNGCPLPNICIPKISSKYLPGQRAVNCTNHCRPSCDLSTSKLCPHVFNADGCSEQETCIPRDEECPISKYDSNGCLIPKPQECDEKTELLCIGGSDINGCNLQDMCIPKKVGNCLQTCPVLCEPDMIQCHNGVDENGCKLPDTCVPKQLPGFDDCNGICPTICKRDQVKCITTKKPEVHFAPFFIQTKHCVINEFCMDIVDKETNCTNFCPIKCEESEQLCEGPVDGKGCRLMDVCVPKMIRGGRGNICPQHCPVNCPEGERPCPGPINSNSCREPPQCVSKEEKCPLGDRDFFGCKVVKEVTQCEDEGSRLCEGVFNKDGCKGSSTCVNKEESCPVSEYDQRGCLILAPTKCDWSHQRLCPTPTDEKKCPTAGNCIEIMKEKCIQFCEPICDPDTQKVCDGGQDANLCPFPKFCYNKNKTCPRKNPFNQVGYEPLSHRKTIDSSRVHLLLSHPFIY